MYYLRITDEPEITGRMSPNRELLHTAARALRAEYGIGSSVSNAPRERGYLNTRSSDPMKIADDIASALRALREMEEDYRSM